MASTQMRFSHMINKLENMSKTVSNQVYVNEILSSMCREWQSKVTIIKDTQDLKTLDMYILFGKLIEHEHELESLEASEENIKRKYIVKKGEEKYILEDFHIQR